VARAEHPKQRLGCRRGPSRIPWHLRACLSQTGRGDYRRRRGLQEEPEGERSDPRADLLNEGRSRIYGQRSCPAPPPGTRSARSTAMARSASTSSPTGRGSTASRCPAGGLGVQIHALIEGDYVEAESALRHLPAAALAVHEMDVERGWRACCRRCASDVHGVEATHRCRGIANDCIGRLGRLPIVRGTAAACGDNASDEHRRDCWDCLSQAHQRSLLGFDMEQLDLVELLAQSAS